MPRRPRNAPGGVIYHALNRGVGRQTLFFKDGDLDAFERIMAEGVKRSSMPTSDWLTRVNEPQSQAELEAVRRSVVRSSPFGSDPWDQAIAQRLDWMQLCGRVGVQGRVGLASPKPGAQRNSMRSSAIKDVRHLFRIQVR